MGKLLQSLYDGAQKTINRIREEIDPMGEAKRKEELKLEDMQANPEKYEKLEEVLLSIKRDPESGKILMFNNIKTTADARDVSFEVDMVITQFRLMILARAQQQNAKTPGGIIIPGSRP